MKGDRHGVFAAAGALSLILLACWVFPSFWYTNSTANEPRVWFQPTNRIAGWTFRGVPLSEAAEAQLAADRFFNGEFARNDEVVVHAFAADALKDDGTASMFAHTPDRCWTGVGWELEFVTPACIELDMHGAKLRVERRLFASGLRQELVYFTALVGGRPLPYRLDQYYDLGRRRIGRLRTMPFGKTISALNGRFFVWPWNVFASRQSLAGAKQFLRVSTPVRGEQLAPADALLKDFLNHWLTAVDYENGHRLNPISAGLRTDHFTRE